MIDSEQVEILLVEDNETDAEMTIRALRRKNLGNNLVWVKDGAEALDFIFRRGTYETRPSSSPRLVLLDLKMPKVDGIEVLRQIKAHDDTKALPVVMLTSSADSICLRFSSSTPQRLANLWLSTGTKESSTAANGYWTTTSPRSECASAAVMPTSTRCPARRGAPRKFTTRLFSVRPDSSPGSFLDGPSTSTR